MSRPPGIRTCIVCGRKRPSQEMLRMVVNREGRVVADPDGILHGRGAWVCQSCVHGLAKVKPARWNRLFRRDGVIAVPEDILSVFETRDRL